MQLKDERPSVAIYADQIRKKDSFFYQAARG